MIALMLGAAFAGPPPFEHVDQVDSFDGCVIKLGRPLAGGLVPLRAECHWPDVTVAAMARVLADYPNAGAYIDCMREVQVLRHEDEQDLVWQLDHLGWGLADRESQTWNTMETAPSACEMRWERSEEPFVPRAGNVIMEANAGGWWVTEAPGGGVDVVQDLRISPGGNVPMWVVNWFQTYGLSDELKRMHALTART